MCAGGATRRDACLAPIGVATAVVAERTVP
jgi:hypothetical protein